MLRALGNDLGFVPFIIGGSSVLYVATLVVSGPNIRMQGLFSLLSPSLPALFLFGASGAAPIFEYGRWWTVLSATWLHGSLLHVFFNMLWVRQLGPAAADIFGGSRMVIIYTMAGVAGFLLSSIGGGFVRIPLLTGAGFTVGASASIFGLLGGLVYYGRRSGSSLVRREAWGYAVPLFIFGLIMPGIDNWAHAGGFAGGYVTAVVLDPLKPERVEHLIAALLCVGLSLLAVAVSILDGLRFF